MVEQDKLQRDFSQGLLHEDVSNLRKLVQLYRDDPSITPELFFSHAIYGFYDVLEDKGLNPTVGHIIFRMSDNVEEKVRRTIPIYPNQEGGTISVSDDEYPWDSLEDWRKQWQRIFPVIPVLTQQLSEEFKLE